MSDLISVLLPTTGRPTMAVRSVEGLRATATGHDVEIVAAVDADPLSHDLLEPVVDRLLYCDEYRGCSRAWNDCLAACTGDPVVFAADDLIWGPGWLDTALARLVEFPGGWGLVGFNDGHWNEQLSTHYLMSRRFIVEVLGGVVAWECYEHSHNDAEVNERARLADRYAWCEDSHVRHAHWLFGDRQQDDTDRRKLAAHGTSEQRFYERREQGFPNDGISPVIVR